VAIEEGTSGAGLRWLWALAAMLILLAALTWRYALDRGDATPAGGSAVATATSTLAPFTSCGEEVDAPDAALNLDGRDCLLAAAAVGTRVEFTTTRYTVEGQPVYWRIRVLAWGDVEVTVDNRADEFSGAARRRVQVHRCTTLTRSATAEHRVEVSGCQDGGALTF